jgi:hypothetical protein
VSWKAHATHQSLICESQSGNKPSKPACCFGWHSHQCRSPLHLTRQLFTHRSLWGSRGAPSQIGRRRLCTRNSTARGAFTTTGAHSRRLASGHVRSGAVEMMREPPDGTTPLCRPAAACALALAQGEKLGVYDVIGAGKPWSRGRRRGTPTQRPLTRHRPRRIGLRRCDARHRWQCGRARGQMQKLPAR